MKPTAGHFIVEILKEENVTSSGIIVDSVNRDGLALKGTVLKGSNPEIKKGDVVYFMRDARQIEEGVYAVREEYILAVN